LDLPKSDLWCHPVCKKIVLHPDAEFAEFRGKSKQKKPDVMLMGT
jgi:hypothetical protein